MKYRHLIILLSFLAISLTLHFAVFGLHNVVNHPVNIQLHDTYYVAPSWGVLVLLFCTFSLVFYLLRQAFTLFRDKPGNWILAVFSLFFVWFIWRAQHQLTDTEILISQELQEENLDPITDKLWSQRLYLTLLMSRIILTTVAIICIAINIISRKSTVQQPKF